MAKAISYRLLGSLSTAALVYWFSGDLRLSAGAGIADSLVKIGLYFAHERLWNLLPFGRVRAADLSKAESV
jgi:uncharacterized membrane protein